MSAFHPTTVTILTYVLGEQQRDLTLFQDRLAQADETTLTTARDRERFPKTVATFRSKIAELTAVIADFTELLRLIAQADADAAEQDRQIAEHDAAEALRIELHLTGPTEAALAELAIRCSPAQHHEVTL